MHPQTNNPLHGITLQQMLTQLVDYYGREQLSHHIPLNCFVSNPSMSSSLKLLRKEPRARQQLEQLYTTTYIS